MRGYLSGHEATTDCRLTYLQGQLADIRREMEKLQLEVKYRSLTQHQAQTLPPIGTHVNRRWHWLKNEGRAEIAEWHDGKWHWGGICPTFPTPAEMWALGWRWHAVVKGPDE